MTHFSMNKTQPLSSFRPLVASHNAKIHDYSIISSNLLKLAQEDSEISEIQNGAKLF